jgi:hypothetical protein
MGTSLGTGCYPIFILYKTNISSYTFVEVKNMTIELEEHLLWFKYDPSEKFVKDLYKVWDTEVVFLAIETSLLVNLHYSNKNYFKIPAAKTRMKKDVYFLFDVVTNVPDVRAKHKRFDYVKYTFIDPERYKD